MTRRFLVTAGNTREMIDRVRDWGNIFTGTTGFRIATALQTIGHVDLLTSNPVHRLQAEKQGIRVESFLSHQDLMSRIETSIHENVYDAIFMTAAVADYRPTGAYAVLQRQTLPDGKEHWVVESVQAGKIKSCYPEIAFVGCQTEKIVDRFRRDWNYRGILVKFKLEVGIDIPELLKIGRASRIASGADYLIANTLDMVEGKDAGAYLISGSGERFVPRDQLPDVCRELVLS
jgi:phosphopantothenoylcysteine synthetase/decarboxylase